MNGSSGYRPSRNFDSPTGTTDTLAIQGAYGRDPDRALQLFFIIYILAENDLAVHRNLRLIERVNLFQGVTCEAVMQRSGTATPDLCFGRIC